MSTTSALLLKTANFAAIKHRDQRRKDAAGTPYINHPIGVATILSEEGGIDDVVVLQAALLHDTVEDTDTTLEELEQIFGAKVASIVAEVTDDKLLPKEERKRLQIVTAAGKSHEAKLVKMADKLYNCRDLETSPPPEWEEARVSEYFRWAKEVVEQIYGESPRLAEALQELFKRHNLL